VTPPTDAEVIRRVLAGEAEAFGILVSRHRDRFTRFALHMLGNREDAEEALQDAFVRSYRSLAQCAERDRFDAWLYRILANRCRTARTRRRRRERTFVPDPVAIERAAGRSQSDAAEWREEIARALAQLTPEQREAFLLKHVEELSYEEMVELSGIGLSALKMRVKRACERLETLLRDSEKLRGNHAPTHTT
jgi:RNA polymerase sigma-70 factor (ECF subfamily)